MGAPDITPPAGGGGGGGGGISGSGTAGYVAQFTGSTAIGDSPIRASGTNVAIDMSVSGSYKLSVNGDTTIVGRIDALSSRISTMSSGLSSDLVLQRDGVEAARIIPGGLVGFGNTNPAATVEAYAAVTGEVRASGDVVSIVSSYSYNSAAAAFAPFVRMSRSRGTRAAPAAVNALDTIGVVQWQARGTTDRAVANISCTAPANAGGDQISGQLTFATAQTTDALPVVRITVNPAGNVGIAQSTPVAPLHVVGTSVASVTTGSPGILRVDGGTVPNQLFFGSFSGTPYGMYMQTNGIPGYPLILQPAGGSVGVKVTNPATNTLDVSTAGWGVKLPSTPGATGAGTENTLDCYAEGNWTPADASGAGMTLTQTGGVTARYTQIGRQVVCFCDITYPATILGGASAAAILLPVSAGTAQGGHFIGGGSTALWGIVSGANLLLYNLNTLTATTNTTIGANRRLIFTLSYFVS